MPSIVVPGETVSSTKFERRPGGKGANQAVAVARAGADVALVGAVGDDGTWVVEGLGRIGVDVGGIHVVHDEPTGRAIIQLTPEGENSIILHRGANYSSIPNTWKDGPYTHLLLQNEIPYDSTIAALEAAYSSGAVTVFNPSPMPSPDQLRTFPWSQLNWLILNQGEATSLLDAFSATTTPHNTDTSAIDLPDVITHDVFGLLRSLRHYPQFSPSINIVCTLGARGVLASAKGSDDPIYVPVAKLDGPVVDTTGAGDCFTGYLVAGLMEKKDPRVLVDRNGLEQLLKTAVQAAGLCVQVPGATESIPSMMAVRDAMRS